MAEVPWPVIVAEAERAREPFRRRDRRVTRWIMWVAPLSFLGGMAFMLVVASPSLDRECLNLARNADRANAQLILELRAAGVGTDSLDQSPVAAADRFVTYNAHLPTRYHGYSEPTGEGIRDDACVFQRPDSSYYSVGLGTTSPFEWIANPLPAGLLMSFFVTGIGVLVIRLRNPVPPQKRYLPSVWETVASGDQSDW